MLPFHQKREALRIFGHARVRRAEELKYQSIDEQDKYVVEFPLSSAGPEISLIPANSNKVNPVGIEVPCSNFTGIGGARKFINLLHHHGGSGQVFLLYFAQ